MDLEYKLKKVWNKSLLDLNAIKRGLLYSKCGWTIMLREFNRPDGVKGMGILEQNPLLLVH
jgi:hypothetical protein